MPVFAEGSVTEQCGESGKFFGLKSWYYYLLCDKDSNYKIIGISESNFKGETTNQDGTTSNNMVTAIWIIVLTVLNDLFFLAGLLAVVLIIYSGIQYITSNGNPGAAAKAKKSLTGTIIGLVIVLVAQVLVNTILGLIA